VNFGKGRRNEGNPLVRRFAWQLMEANARAKMKSDSQRCIWSMAWQFQIVFFYQNHAANFSLFTEPYGKWKGHHKPVPKYSMILLHESTPS